ncbi:MAG TPA: amidohydrolase family protein [Gammaproteobacteria bacterium]
MTTRRMILQGLLAAGVLARGRAARAQVEHPPEVSIRRGVPYKRIATEEAYSTDEVLDLYRSMIERNTSSDPGFVAMWGAFLRRDPDFFDQLTSLGERRLRDMDTMGTHMHVLSLTAPGVQVFDAQTATAVARSTNDRLAEAVRNHPDRFAGLVTIAPQDPRGAAQEIERGMTTLGLHGIIVNSHTNGEYLDDERYWEIFEAAEAHDAAIYIHPTTPAPAMLEPYLSRGLHGPLAGFAADVYLHSLALIVNGVFDRFPRLKIVLGHLGEGLPYVMYRLDHMQGQAPGLARKINDYLKDNFYVTTSGMAWPPAIEFAQQVLGASRVLYAMDYPYQFDAAEVVTTDELDISDEDKLKLYQTNAEAVFHLRRS